MDADDHQNELFDQAERMLIARDSLRAAAEKAVWYVFIWATPSGESGAMEYQRTIVAGPIKYLRIMTEKTHRDLTEVEQELDESE